MIRAHGSLIISIGAYLEMATGGTGRIDIAQALSTLAGALGAQQPAVARQPAQQSAQQPAQQPAVARQPIPHIPPQSPLPPQPLPTVNQIPGKAGAYFIKRGHTL